MRNPFTPHPVVAEIIASLRNEPGEWTNRTGWTRSDDAFGNAKWFAETGDMWIDWGCMFMIPNTLDRYRLRKAVKQWRKRRE